MVIIGVGNQFRGDDGLGRVVSQRIKSQLPARGEGLRIQR